ncbi:RNA polymerase sigma factor [Lysinibacter cavernae]|uniref:RNA polymerase sigma factor (Sigma-70 family) n=1 Tax=Lysinibacter cavernae TaxID=1640652 RepID=A0A7X5R0L0_9MICO|nr:sigma-70 family RNA polymerase sigma factor [Lysinibacter cavernae]NIH53252.1 RNA polymerase sigma factor (sigma-70 family) [Lysinibacter cavernae]
MENTQRARAEEDELITDAVLCDRVRHGDVVAFTELYNRNYENGIRYALHLVRDRRDAEDLLSEAFERILGVLNRGKGPTESFRAYLNMVLRNLHIRAVDVATVALPDDADNYLPQLQELDRNEEMGERELVYEAFRQLPERWQSVLWLIEVDGLDLSDVGAKIGMNANAVAQLALRARDGLKVAYLSLHAEQMPSGECHAMAEKLARFVRNQSGKRDSVSVQNHLDGCEACRRSVERMSDVGKQMRAVVAPLILGGSGVGLAAFAGGSSGSASAAVVAPTSTGFSVGAKLALVGSAAVLVTGAVFGGLALADQVTIVPVTPVAIDYGTHPVESPPVPADAKPDEPVVETPVEVLPEPTLDRGVTPAPAAVQPPEAPAVPAPVAESDTPPPAPPAAPAVIPPSSPAPAEVKDDTTPGWEAFD